MFYRLPLALSIIGAVLLSIAIALPFIFPTFFESQINKKLIIKPDSDMFKNFRETPIPIYFQIWFFNLTNAESVGNGAKPKLQQVGPFTYEQRRQKIDIQWNRTTGTVSFKSKKFYYFKPDLSVLPESALITTVNPVFLSLASKVSGNNVPGIVKPITNLWFYRFDSKFFMTHSVKELTFSGYSDALLKELYKLTKSPAHEKGKAGFFVSSNGTIGKEVEIFTGELGMRNYQNILKFDQKEALDYWKEARCNVIQGTDGAQFPRPVKTSQNILLFTPDLCRAIYAVYEKDVELGPLKLHRFILPKSILDSSEENKCFCSSNFTCKAGVIDVSPCRDGSPIAISTPHFYQGDIELQEAVEGLSPSKDEHETFLDVEPTTGVSMRVAKRIQINMLLKRFGNIPSVAKVPEVIMPILWVNESVVMPEDRVLRLHTTLTLPLKVVAYGSWVLLGLGILLVLIAYLLTFSIYKKNKKLAKERKLSEKKEEANTIALLQKNKLYQESSNR